MAKLSRKARPEKRPGCVYRWIEGWGWGLFSRSGKAHKHKPPRLSCFDKEAAATASERLESEFFGGFKPSSKGTFPFRYRQTSPGWADQRPPAREYPFVFYAAWEATGAQPEPLPGWAERILDRWPVVPSYGPTLGDYLDAAAFYKPPRHWTATNSKPSAVIQARRIQKAMKGAAKATPNQQLTKRYLAGTPGCVRDFWRLQTELGTQLFLARGGTIQQCPAEKTAKQAGVRMGRRLIGERPMTDAEYKRRSRAKQKAKTLPPQERHQPGAVVPPPQGPAVPGPNLWLVERNKMLLERMVAQQDEILARLDQLLEVLLKDPSRPITREEFQLLAWAGSNRQRPHQ